MYKHKYTGTFNNKQCKVVKGYTCNNQNIDIRPSLNSYFPALSYQHIHSDCLRSHLSMEDSKFATAVEKE